MAQKPTPSAMSDKPTAPAPDAAATAAPAEETTPAGRSEEASKLIERFSVYSGAAGLIPFPLVDVATIAGVQLQMLRRLSQLYGVEFTDNRGKSILASLAGAVVPATGTLGVVSLLKSVPVIGTLAASATMPFAGAGATWVVGKVFVQHFESGGSLLDFNPPDYREFIKQQREKWRTRTTAQPSTEQPAAAGATPPSPGSDAAKGASAGA